MDKKDIDAIYNLMQNVVDKLDNISNKIESENQNKNEPEIQNILKKQDTTIGYLIHLNDGLENRNKEKTETANNYNEYVLFGKDSTMNNRLLFILASFILIAYLGFKFLAPVIIEKGELESQNANYQIMYEYLYLKGLRNEPIKYSIEQIAKQIRSRDAIFLEEYDKMVSEDKMIKRRIELETELKKLK